MLHKLMRVNSIRLPLLVACAALASCDDHFHGCYGCGNITPTEFSNGVVSADFNGDGFADVVALSTVQPSVSQAPSNIKAYLSTAAGAFAAPVSTPDGFNPLYLASADLNGDGLMDVVTASFDDGALGVFFNNKTSPGSFNPALVLNSPGASQVALTDSVGVKVLMHTGAASSTTFAAPVSVFTQTPNANVAGGNIIAIGDVDGDGLNDLVITDPGPTGGMATAVYILIQNPASHGTFLTPVGYAIATQDRPQSILLRDLQGTGKLDIVIGGQKFVTVLLHDPANPGKFLPAGIYTAPGANEIAIADINGDGKL